MRSGVVVSDTPSPDPKPSFEERLLVAPFGRFTAAGPPEGTDTDNLVGRDRQRGDVLNFLRQMGRRGAVLVTGHRGAGKTTFVQQCLHEYDHDVFDRFLRSRVGRTWFWDKVLLVVLTAVALAGLVMVYELMNILVYVILESQALSRSDSSGSSWLFTAVNGLLLVPLVLVAALPVLYASRMLEVAISPPDEHGKPGESNGEGASKATGIRAWLARGLAVSRTTRQIGVPIVVLLLTVMWAYSPLTSAATTVGAFLFLASLTLLAVRTLPARSAWVSFFIPILGPIALWCQPWFDPWSMDGWRFLIVLSLIALGAGELAQLVRRAREGDGGDRASSGALSDLIGSIRLLLGLKAVLAVLLALQLCHPVVVLVLHSPGLPHVSGKEQSAQQESTQQESAVTATHQEVTSNQEARYMVQAFEKRAAQTGSARQTDATQHADNAQKTLVAWSSLFEVGKERYESGPVGSKLAWIVTTLCALVLLFRAEYDYILQPAFTRGATTGSDRLSQRWMRYKAAPQTLPWLVYRAWLPLIKIPVNLGVEGLDHPRVIKAMLAGLKDRYHNEFLSWHSRFGLVLRLASFVLLLMVTNLLSKRFFELPAVAEHGEGTSQPEVSPLEAAEEGSFCGNFHDDHYLEFERRGEIPPTLKILCNAAGKEADAGDVAIPLLYMDLFAVVIPAHIRHDGQAKWGNPLGQADDLLCLIVPCEESNKEQERKEGTSKGQRQDVVTRGEVFRLYHLLTLGLVFVVWSFLRRSVPLVPYRAMHERMEDMLDRLESRRTVSDTNSWWNVSVLVRRLGMRASTDQKEMEPVDSRVLEFEFLHILNELQQPTSTGWARRPPISLPAPEVIFVFDEIDKIGVKAPPSATPSQEAEVKEQDRADMGRNRELHALVSEMKNVLASAPARFFFVGGRELHDEWLADLTDRRPLLTSVFRLEVYLPSLLADDPPGVTTPMHARIEEYVVHQHRRASVLYEDLKHGRSLPSYALPAEYPEMPARPSPTVDPRTAAGGKLQEMEIHELKTRMLTEAGGDSKCWTKAEPAENVLILRDLVQFLSLRSVGNPKKLGELLESLIRPVEDVQWRLQATSDVKKRKDEDVAKMVGEALAELKCAHVLLLQDDDRYRIQLLAEIYRLIEGAFRQRLSHRDDKIHLSLIYLTDFLFKFHRRAFTWTHLERVDELVHVHRAHDHRQILEELVNRWSERYLHVLRNGMYDFRFRSDFAAEIAYISRRSESEMAALNFTLDESAALKRLYVESIQRMGEKVTSDMQSALGELYEFDQDYDSARYWYERAIATLDQRLGCEVRDGQLLEEALAGELSDPASLRSHLVWGVSRIRLMLQIGLTMELANDAEGAFVQYQDTRVLAWTLIRALLDAPQRRRLAESPSRSSLGIVGGDTGSSDHGHGLNALQHLSILFQPMFAEAWVAEKMPLGVDTAATVVEESLNALRAALPFVCKVAQDTSDQASTPDRSNFALQMADLHNKAGDLYFIKGRMLPDKTSGDAPDGFLQRAQAHYAQALHELRRYVSNRKATSTSRLHAYKPSKRTILSSQWADFPVRAIGNTLVDIAEVVLARMRFSFLRDELDGTPAAQDAKLKELHERLIEWIEDERPPTPDDPDISLPLGRQTRLSSWLGSLSQKSEEALPHLTIHYADNAPEEIKELDALAFALAAAMSSARILADNGYPEDAGREYLQIAETVSHLCWWRRIALGLGICGRIAEASTHWKELWDTGCVALKEARLAFEKAREERPSVGQPSDKEGADGSPSDLLPRPIFVMASSLSLVRGQPAGATADKDNCQRELEKILSRFSGGASDKPSQILDSLLQRYPYPMVSHLHALKVWIDHSALAWLCALRDGALPDEVNSLEMPERILEAAVRLEELEERFNSPLHFTSFHIGVSLGLACVCAPRVPLLRRVKARTRVARDRLTGKGVSDWQGPRVEAVLLTITSEIYESCAQAAADASTMARGAADRLDAKPVTIKANQRRAQPKSDRNAPSQVETLTTELDEILSEATKETTSERELSAVLRVAKSRRGQKPDVTEASLAWYTLEKDLKQRQGPTNLLEQVGAAHAAEELREAIDWAESVQVRIQGLKEKATTVIREHKIREKAGRAEEWRSALCEIGAKLSRCASDSRLCRSEVENLKNVYLKTSSASDTAQPLTRDQAADIAKFLGTISNWRGGTPEFDQNWIRLRRSALRHLKRTQELVTMRRRYYEVMSGLYYLFDDFNDRQLHFNYAIQMAGLDVVAWLREELERLELPLESDG